MQLSCKNRPSAMQAANNRQEADFLPQRKGANRALAHPKEHSA